MLEIQLPLFPARAVEGLEANALLREHPSMHWVAKRNRRGPTLLHFVEGLGVWLVSTQAGIRGPSGNVGMSIQYVFPEIFLLHQEKKAIRFALRAAEPWLEQSYHYVASCMITGRPIQPYEGYQWGRAATSGSLSLIVAGRLGRYSNYLARYASMSSMSCKSFSLPSCIFAARNCSILMNGMPSWMCAPGNNS